MTHGAGPLRANSPRSSSLGRPGDETPRLVVLRALGLGDFLTGLPALRALAAAYPTHRRILAAPRRYRSLITDGAVHDIVDHTGLGALDRTLNEPDVAVDLHGRGPASQPLLLALRPRRLIAFAHPAVAATTGGPRWRPDEHEIDRWCRLLSESGIPADPSRLTIKLRPGPIPIEAAGATVVHPGAASPARRWPPERFAAVVRHELGQGRPVVITGSSAERALGEAVAAAAGLDHSQVLAGDTDVAGLARIIAVADRVVCGDTGVGHLATALGTPSVILFGPVPPSEWGPPVNRGHHVALWAGRRGDPHGMEVDPGLLAIHVEQVKRALADLPASSRPSRGPRTREAAGNPRPRTGKGPPPIVDRRTVAMPRTALPP